MGATDNQLRYDMHILLVEDSASDVMITQRACKRAGLAQPLTVVNDGEEALKYLFAKPPFSDRSIFPLPDLVLLDINMPRFSGIDTLRVIRGESSLSWLPIIVLSSSQSDKDIAASYLAGARAYIRKPIDFDDFQQVISSLLAFWVHTLYPSSVK